MKTLIIFLAFSLLFASSFANASAKIESKTDYETLDHKLSGTPTFCILEPQRDPILPETLVPLLINEAKASIDVWTTSLKSNSKRNANWDVDLKIVPRDKQGSYDKSKCDILMQFKRKDPNEIDPLTLFKNKPLPRVEQYSLPNYRYYKQNNTFFVEIFYQAKGTCETRDYISSDTYIKTSWDCRQNDVSPIEMLGAVMRHAVGHAFGLGHYPSYTGSSIMSQLPKLQGFDVNSSPKDIMVRSLDIQKLKEIYGDQGWGGQKIKEPEKKKIAPTSITTKIIQIKKGQTLIEKISGSVSLYKQGGRADVSVLKPDGTRDIQIVGVTNKGKFEYQFVITDKTTLGKYMITISYLGNEVKKIAYELR